MPCKFWLSGVVEDKLQRILRNPKSFSTSALSLTLLAIWAFSNAVAFGINLSLQIIREDYHPVNIVFQVVHPHLLQSAFFSRFSSREAISSASSTLSGAHPGNV